MVNINTFMVDATDTGPYGLSLAFLCAYDQFMVWTKLSSEFFLCNTLIGIAKYCTVNAGTQIHNTRCVVCMPSKYANVFFLLKHYVSLCRI
jgi:hypothetical protein